MEFKRLLLAAQESCQQFPRLGFSFISIIPAAILLFPMTAFAILSLINPLLGTSVIASKNPYTFTAVSTLIMMVLLSIGLFFFIRASGKDRTEIRRYSSEMAVDELGAQLKQYLLERSYQLTEMDESGLATFIGQGQPSGFMTGLLTSLAVIGLVCVALVLQTANPALQGWSFLLVAVSPVAGWYYRKKNTREETLKVRVRELDEPQRTQVDISGHRDELDLLPLSLPVTELWEE